VVRDAPVVDRVDAREELVQLGTNTAADIAALAGDAK
jgi:hypothetical protein